MDLQEPRRRKRWGSDIGQQVCSVMSSSARDVHPPRARQEHTDGVQGWENELRGLVWNGIPADMRERVYMSLSGASSFRGAGDLQEGLRITQLIRADVGQ